MIKYLAICDYCGESWEEAVWNRDSLSNVKCRCKSKVNRFKEIDEHSKDVFGYRFSKPFSNSHEVDPCKNR